MANMPATRTLNAFREAGYHIGNVERFVYQIRKRFDFMGFADMIAYRPPLMGCIALQATSSGHVADHVEKLTNGEVGERVKAWLIAGNRLEVWGWSKKGKAGKRKLYTPRVIQLTWDGKNFYQEEATELRVFLGEHAESRN